MEYLLLEIQGVWLLFQSTIHLDFKCRDRKCYFQNVTWESAGERVPKPLKDVVS